MINKREKFIHNIAAKYISGKSLDIELSGNKHEIECFASLLEVSKKLYDILNDNKSSLTEANDLLRQKKEATKHFESLTGITWRL
jgi:hypothetical protein